MLLSFPQEKTNRSCSESENWQGASESFRCKQACYSFFSKPTHESISWRWNRKNKFFFSINQTNKTSVENNNNIIGRLLMPGFYRRLDSYDMVMPDFLTCYHFGYLCMIEASVTKKQLPHMLEMNSSLNE